MSEYDINQNDNKSIDADELEMLQFDLGSITNSLFERGYRYLRLLSYDGPNSEPHKKITCIILAEGIRSGVQFAVKIASKARIDKARSVNRLFENTPFEEWDRRVEILRENDNFQPENLIRFFNFFETSSYQFLVMELCDGGDAHVVSLLSHYRDLLLGQASERKELPKIDNPGDHPDRWSLVTPVTSLSHTLEWTVPRLDRVEQRFRTFRDMTAAVAKLHQLEWSHSDVSLCNFALISEESSRRYESVDVLDGAEIPRHQHPITGSMFIRPDDDDDENRIDHYRVVLIDLGQLRPIQMKTETEGEYQGQSFQQLDVVRAGKRAYLEDHADRGCPVYLTAVDTWALAVCGYMLLSGDFKTFLNRGTSDAARAIAIEEIDKMNIDANRADLLRRMFSSDLELRPSLPAEMVKAPLLIPADDGIQNVLVQGIGEINLNE